MIHKSTVRHTGSYARGGCVRLPSSDGRRIENFFALLYSNRECREYRKYFRADKFVWEYCVANAARRQRKFDKQQTKKRFRQRSKEEIKKELESDDN